MQYILPYTYSTWPSPLFHLFPLRDTCLLDLRLTLLLQTLIFSSSSFTKPLQATDPWRRHAGPDTIDFQPKQAMASTDVPRRNLSLHLRRGRKDADRTDSNSSVGSGPMDDHSSGLKPSIDNVFAKVKERRARKSQDLRRNSDDSSKGLRGLLPSSKRSRRKSSTQDSDLLSASPSADLISDHQRGTSPNPSELSLGNQGSGHSSLLTEDEDDQA